MSEYTLRGTKMKPYTAIPVYLCENEHKTREKMPQNMRE